ncbi:hypothetical protein [Sinosporangium siamense]|uniref:Nucleotidyltransferase family protein n=1 Tax=Sinosporangium siamense TaxID=1367973 RepID=A0A919VAK7_9ACTN|nr:hypothetical protein [Sinosporangium siamense]GII95522.1 hypothetical protein Ssi02_57530 [Sinosporangium siamense]
MDGGGTFLRAADITATLDTVLTAMQAADADLAYRVAGTSAAVLQGVRLPAGDIDMLVTRREDVDRFAAALSSFPCLHAASWLPGPSQYFARYEVGGVAVEISTVERRVDSDGMECVGRGPWRHCVWITCGSHQVPVVRLELRLATELVRDRVDHYEPLLDHMRARGFDFDLLYRAMRDQGLSAERQRLVWDRLTY